MQDFEGRVDSIAAVAQTVEGEQMIAVRSRLSGKNENLKPGMKGVARIYAGKRPILRIATRRMERLVEDGVRSLLALRNLVARAVSIH